MSPDEDLLPGEGLRGATIAEAVAQYGLNPLPSGVADRFSAYFDLLQHWNAKLNLTAIRSPGEILRRHFIECIFCAQQIPAEVSTLLDYGSGAGFPGIPIALCRGEIRVTLGESQGKKASFLREAVRTLGLDAEVYAGRIEDMAVGRRFDAVTMRAVDKMDAAVAGAVKRVSDGGWLVVMATANSLDMPDGFSVITEAIPGSDSGMLILAQRDIVPRGT